MSFTRKEHISEALFPWNAEEEIKVEERGLPWWSSGWELPSSAGHEVRALVRELASQMLWGN